MGLGRYVIRRVLLMIPTLIGITLLIFGVVQLFPARRRAALYINDLRQIGDIDYIVEKYGLNDPVYIQYFTWIEQVLQGNLGWSKSLNMPVKDAIISRAPATIEIAVFSVPIIVFLGIYLGIKSAVHKDKAVDHATRVFSIIGWSLPTFWAAIMLLAIFYGGLGFFPPERLGTEATIFVHSAEFIRYTGLNTIDGLLNGQPWITLDALQHLVLPIGTLIIIAIALIIRIMRSSMLEALSKGYIITARAKGLTKNEVINKHAKKNAMIPVITVSGILAAGLLTGVVVVEAVFSYPGLGGFAATAALQLDIPAVLGFALVAGAIFVVANLIVDVLYAYADPRIRLG